MDKNFIGDIHNFREENQKREKSMQTRHEVKVRKEKRFSLTEQKKVQTTYLHINMDKHPNYKKEKHSRIKHKTFNYKVLKLRAWIKYWLRKKMYIHTFVHTKHNNDQKRKIHSQLEGNTKITHTHTQDKKIEKYL